MSRRLANSPRFPATAPRHASPRAHDDGGGGASRGPRVASIAVLFGVLGAAVYLATVFFALGDGGLTHESDHTAARITLGVAGALAGIGFILALLGLGKRGQRGAAFVAFVISAAFVAFVALSFLRGNWPKI